MKKNDLSPEAFRFEGKMSLKQALPLGMQHVLAMFVGNLTPLLIITGACGLAGGEFADLRVTLLQNAMLVAGIVTLVQLYSIGPSAARFLLSWVPPPASSGCSARSQPRWAAVCWPTARSWARP